MTDAAAKATPMRLDEALVARGLFRTRSRARDAILRGTVTLDGRKEQRPAARVAPGGVLAVDDPASRYVSRAALKLVAGLDAFSIDPSGRDALDIGASTGGFTQVLLERGARRVVAIEVGHGQLDATLAGDPKILLREGLNARDLALADIDGADISLVVCDVSFISLRLALPPALEIARPGAACVLLVKPQFEVGREGVGKGGLVEPAAAERVAGELLNWLESQPGWRALGLAPSPIEGGDGNREFLLGGLKDTDR